MRTNLVNSKLIYKPVNALEEDVFAYPLKFNGKEVGFAVLDVATKHPDFSNCGMFWINPYEFVKLFKPHMVWKK